MVHINKFPSNCDLWIMWFANQSLQTSCPKRTLRFDMQSLMSNDACPSHYSMQGSVSERFSAEFGMTWFFQTCHGIQMYHTLFLFLFSFFWLITRFAHHSTNAITHLPSFVSAASPRPPPDSSFFRFPNFLFLHLLRKRKTLLGFTLKLQSQN